ncbi:MAG: hypothetical protein HY689_06765 [Chloroflexi bacterium]|nr:hypothetical protein [Chloroflexota bacterium]
MIYAIRCDVVPGKSHELDTFLRSKHLPFWMAQPGVRAFRVYEDMLVGYPERTIEVDLEDLSCLQRILGLEEHRRLKEEFLQYATSASSQLLNVTLEHGTAARTA